MHSWNTCKHLKVWKDILSRYVNIYQKTSSILMMTNWLKLKDKCSTLEPSLVM